MHFPFTNEFELIKKYRFNSIFWVYFRYIFLITFIPIMVISILVTTYYATVSSRSFGNTSYDKFRIVSENFDTALTEADKAHFQLTSSPDISAFSRHGYKTNDLESMNASRSIYDSLLNLVNSGNHINEIHVYFPSQGYIISNTETNKFESHTRNHLFDRAVNDNILKYFVSDKSKNILHYACPIPAGANYTAVVVYDINMSNILLAAGENTDIYITDKTGGKVLYSTNEETASPGNMAKAIDSPGELVSTAGTATVCFPLNNAQYNFVGVARNTAPDGLGSTLRLIIICMLFITIFLPLFISFYFSSRFYRSITELTSAFNDVGGDPDANANELKFLSSSIFSTIEKNKAIENQLTASAKNLKLLQSQALQMQISPHFIFNTLNLANVIVMRELKRSNDAETVISHLATLISAVLDNKNTIIPVSEEMKYIEEFIEIEKIRFKNKFDVIYEIDAGVYSRNIIKFTLQPIIENSFEYGIKPMKDIRGKIKIKAYNEGADTVFKITDNGEGFEPERLREINWAMASDSPTPPSSHIGLYNVNKRIKLMCGSMYGIHITSVPGETCVTIRFCLS